MNRFKRTRLENQKEKLQASMKGIAITFLQKNKAIKSLRQDQEVLKSQFNDLKCQIAKLDAELSEDDPEPSRYISTFKPQFQYA